MCKKIALIPRKAKSQMRSWGLPYIIHTLSMRTKSTAAMTKLDVTPWT
jgi:hypothetical protein